MHFEPLAQQATLLDYLHEVEHMAARVTRLEQAIEEAVQLAPHQMREVIEALQALRGIAKVSADDRSGARRAIPGCRSSTVNGL